MTTRQDMEISKTPGHVCSGDKGMSHHPYAQGTWKLVVGVGVDWKPQCILMFPSDFHPCPTPRREGPPL